MTLYISWRLYDQTQTIVNTILAEYTREPLRGAIISTQQPDPNIARLTSNVSTSTMFIWVVGPHTLNLVDEQGHRLLARRDDLQRTELDAALKNKIPILIVRDRIPVINEDDLPRGLRSLAAMPQLDWTPDHSTLAVIMQRIQFQRINHSADRSADPLIGPVHPLASETTSRRAEALRRGVAVLIICCLVVIALLVLLSFLPLL